MTGALATPRLAADIEVPLTQRESEVLRQLAYGLTNKEIANTLKISYETVKEHVQHILRKIGVSDRTQAAVWAVAKNWFDGSGSWFVVSGQSLRVFVGCVERTTTRRVGCVSRTLRIVADHDSCRAVRLRAAPAILLDSSLRLSSFCRVRATTPVKVLTPLEFTL